MSSADAETKALDELLTHIRNESQREREEINAQAARVARAILRDARHDARMRVARALAIERAARETESTRERAAADTQLRMQRQLLARQALDQCWNLLVENLSQIWRDPGLRAEWTSAALRQASSFLRSRSWRVHVAPDWSPSQRDAACVDAAIAEAAITIEWVTDEALNNGLRIEADGAVLDATATGLVTRREQIEGWLLAAIDAQEQAGGIR
ncbi:MAG: hypothetical protein WBV39_06500 [Rudaea sp.]